MRVIDIPEFRDKSDVLCFTENENVDAAIKKMAELRIGSAVVITGDRKVAGIFTERDVMMKVVAKDKDPKQTNLKDVMTSDVKVAKMNDEILTCLRRMSQGRFRHLPVVDDDGKLIGILSQGDFVAFTWGQLFSQLKNQAKASFLSFTQLWMIITALALYVLGVIVYFHYFE